MTKVELSKEPFAFGGEGELYHVFNGRYDSECYIDNKKIYVKAKKIRYKGNLILLYGDVVITDNYSFNIKASRIYIDTKVYTLYLSKNSIINNNKFTDSIKKFVNKNFINRIDIQSIQNQSPDEFNKKVNLDIFTTSDKFDDKLITRTSPVCAKVFFPHITNKEDKLKLMVKINPDFNSSVFKFCWPENLIYKNNKFMGYVMPLANSKELIRLYELCTTNVNKKFSYWVNKCDRSNAGILTRLKICINLCLSIYNLHKGIDNYKFNIIDLKPQNILLDKNGKIYIVDLDSIEIKDKVSNNNYPAKVLTPEYTPKEKYDNDPNYNNDNCDNFALAVIIYEILFGIHPYTATFNVKADTIQEKIKNDLYVHNVQHYVKILPPPHKNIEKFSPLLKRAFIKSFCTKNKTTAEEWGNILFKEIAHIESLTKVDNLVQTTIDKITSKNITVNTTWDKYRTEALNEKLTEMTNEIIKNNETTEQISKRKSSLEETIANVTIITIIILIICYITYIAYLNTL
jgi:hypothetical protein